MQLLNNTVVLAQVQLRAAKSALCAEVGQCVSNKNDLQMLNRGIKGCLDL